MTVSFECAGPFHYAGEHGNSAMSDLGFTIFLLLQLVCLVALYASA
jgi:hypothetical protein